MRIDCLRELRMRYYECRPGSKKKIALVQHLSLNSTEHSFSYSAQVLFYQVGKSVIRLWFPGKSKINMVFWVWLLPRCCALPCNSHREGRWRLRRIQGTVSCLSHCDFFFTKKALICWRRIVMCSITTIQHKTKQKTFPYPLRDRAVKQPRSHQQKTNQSCLGFEGKLLKRGKIQLA